MSRTAAINRYLQVELGLCAHVTEVAGRLVARFQHEHDARAFAGVCEKTGFTARVRAPRPPLRAEWLVNAELVEGAA